MPARLYHERIARSDAAPARWLALTHGIYGAGSNWRSIARKLNERRPEWGVVLVDLRQHGRSEPGEPPHTIAACADDLRALFGELGGVDAVAGHSFGGKVALATRPLIQPRQTWVLDASPSPRPGAAVDTSIPRGALPPAPPAEPAGSPPPVSSLRSPSWTASASRATSSGAIPATATRSSLVTPPACQTPAAWATTMPGADGPRAYRLHFPLACEPSSPSVGFCLR